MSLVEAITGENGVIVLDPGAMIDGQGQVGFVEPEWFQTTFPALAAAPVPLSSDDFAELKAIDSFWSQNADRWRQEGRI